MNWKKLTCWLKGHDWSKFATQHIKIDDRWEVMYVVHTCKRCLATKEIYDCE